ncbi:tail completion protein gp17 [Alterisphingorhabdus coralli]|uniref:DUF3168 domain-containing protein n=1 Tax=Alterisphingorhabdus coralli TaxID=3071408 RepID=A0AA97F8W9_9SPHN|nr:DUF3168 domain-containing protein [Parasphingorhabdus sp. SCSIO 66989]WOE75681.1 DUF3168 domain-containing protein [Parasphingorhabdus sp. SCSIO 66989]
MTVSDLQGLEAPDFALRQHIEDWLSQSPILARHMAHISDQSRRPKARPALQVTTTQTADWSGKGFAGREVELVLTLAMRGEDKARFSALIAAMEERMANVPDAFSAGRIVTLIPQNRRTALTQDGVWRMRSNWRARAIIS